MKRTFALLAAFILILLTAACGGSDDGGFFEKQPGQTKSGAQSGTQGGAQPQVQTGAGTGACALVTKQDAAAALGAAVKDGESVTLPRQNMGAVNVEISACDYRAVSGPGQVSLQRWKAPQANQVSLIASSICSQGEKINGIGDSACWLDKDHKELQLYKGATFIGLTVRGAPGNTDDAMKALAKKIADRVK